MTILVVSIKDIRLFLNLKIGKAHNSTASIETTNFLLNLFPNALLKMQTQLKKLLIPASLQTGILSKKNYLSNSSFKVYIQPSKNGSSSKQS